MKKIFLFATLIIFANIFASNVHAEIKTYTGVGEYIISMKETPEFGYKNAQLYAQDDVIKQVGIFIKSYSEIINSQLKKDEIITFAKGTLKNIKILKREPIPLENESEGYLKFRVTISAEVDADDFDSALDEWKKRDENEKANSVQKDNEQQKLIEDLQKRIKQLENDLANAKTSHQKEKIQQESLSIDKATLYVQKIDEGWQTWRNKNFEQALKFFDEAVNLNQNDYQGYYGRGTTNLDLKNYQQAISEFNQAIKINPNYSSAYNNRGLTYKILKNYEQAISDYTQSIKLNPNAYVTYNNLGNICRILKNYDKAAENLNKCVQINPNYSLAYYNRGLVYYELKNYEKAVEDFSKYIQLEPDDYDGYRMRGKCYKALGKNAESEKDFAKAKELGWKG